MIGVGEGAPGRRAGEQCSGDLDAVEVGDEAVVVTHPQGQGVEGRGVARDGEGDADVAACALGVHLAAHVDAEEVLVAGAAFEADAAGAGDPGRVVHVRPPRQPSSTGPVGTRTRLDAFSGTSVVDLLDGPDDAGRTWIGAIERVVERAARVGADEGHGVARLEVAAVGDDAGRGDKLAIDPLAARPKPLLEMVDLALETAVARTLGRAISADCGPGPRGSRRPWRRSWH